MSTGKKILSVIALSVSSYLFPSVHWLVFEYFRRRCSLSGRSRQFWWEPHVALNEPGYDRKKKARRESTHQYPGDTFYRTQDPPCPREKQISIPDRRITGCGEVECRFPRRKAIPAVKCGP